MSSFNPGSEVLTKICNFQTSEMSAGYKVNPEIVVISQGYTLSLKNMHVSFYDSKAYPKISFPSCLA